MKLMMKIMGITRLTNSSNRYVFVLLLFSPHKGYSGGYSSAISLIHSRSAEAVYSLDIIKAQHPEQLCYCLDVMPFIHVCPPPVD